MAVEKDQTQGADTQEKVHPASPFFYPSAPRPQRLAQEGPVPTLHVPDATDTPVATPSDPTAHDFSYKEAKNLRHVADTHKAG